MKKQLVLQIFQLVLAETEGPLRVDSAVEEVIIDRGRLSCFFIEDSI